MSAAAAFGAMAPEEVFTKPVSTGTHPAAFFTRTGVGSKSTLKVPSGCAVTSCVGVVSASTSTGESDSAAFCEAAASGDRSPVSAVTDEDSGGVTATAWGLVTPSVGPSKTDATSQALRPGTRLPHPMAPTPYSQTPYRRVIKARRTPCVNRLPAAPSRSNRPIDHTRHAKETNRMPHRGVVDRQRRLKDTAPVRPVNPKDQKERENLAHLSTKPHPRSGGSAYANTTVRRPLSRIRRSACHFTARASACIPRRGRWRPAGPG